MAGRDYYEVLGVSREADEEAIRRAFRSLARRLHPDISEVPDAEHRFRELTAAYGVLSKPSARFLYDRFGYRGRGNGGFGSRPSRGARILAEIEIDDFEARRGTRREVRLAGEEECGVCGGGGAAPGTRAQECDTCGGSGRVRVSSDLRVGEWLQIEQCSECNGVGRVYAQPCPECQGLGRLAEERLVRIRVPPGVEDGTRLRVLGEPENNHLLVRVRPLRDSRLVRWAATALLVCAVALLAYFIWWS